MATWVRPLGGVDHLQLLEAWAAREDEAATLRRALIHRGQMLQLRMPGCVVVPAEGLPVAFAGSPHKRVRPPPRPEGTTWLGRPVSLGTRGASSR